MISNTLSGVTSNTTVDVSKGHIVNAIKEFLDTKCESFPIKDLKFSTETLTLTRD